MRVLSKRQILMLHSMLVAQSGGADGLRDEGLLESAINTPLQTFGGQEHCTRPFLKKPLDLAMVLFTITLFWMAINALEPMPCWCFWTSTTLHFLMRMMI